MSKHKNEETQETAVAVIPQGGEVAPAGLLGMFAEMSGAGMEEVTSDALANPYIKLLQAKHPEVENDPDIFKPGMLVHTVSGERYDIRAKGGKALKFVQAYFFKQIVEWGDKDAGNGGIKGRHECTPTNLKKLENLPRNDKRKAALPNGNTLEETAYHAWILLPENGPATVAVLPMKSTQLTPSKRLMRTIDQKLITVNGKSIKPPSFAFVYSVESFLDKQKNGNNTFQNVRFAEVGMLTDEEVFRAAQAFYKSFKSGEVKLNDEQEAGVESGINSHDDAVDADTYEGAGDDNVPF